MASQGGRTREVRKSHREGTKITLVDHFLPSLPSLPWCVLASFVPWWLLKLRRQIEPARIKATGSAGGRSAAGPGFAASTGGAGGFHVRLIF
jgi:hypothetical protein